MTLQIDADDLYVPSAPPQVRIHLRRKCLASGPVPEQRKVVLFVHGATFCGMSAFDAPLSGGSWLDFVAARGCDAYAMDVRGYGWSSRPAFDGHNPLLLQRPYARTDEAIADLGAAVEFVQARTGAERVDLIGWSWGTAICGGYAAQNPDKVGRVVMFGPLWVVRDLPTAGLPQALMPLIWLPHLGPWYSAWLGSFRSVTFDDARRRWVRGLDESTAEALCPRRAMSQWWQYTLGVGSGREIHSGAALHEPNGVVADLIEHWAAGAPTYDPGRITAPVLAVLGEWDVDTPLYMAQELFGRLTACPHKRLEVLARGTHAMSLEANRFELYERVQQFLETPVETPLATLTEGPTRTLATGPK